MSVAVGSALPVLTTIGFIAAALHVATPPVVIEASMLSETVHLGAGNGGSGHPFGTATLRVYVWALSATVWSRVAVVGVIERLKLHAVLPKEATGPHPTRAAQPGMASTKQHSTQRFMGEFYARTLPIASLPRNVEKGPQFSPVHHFPQRHGVSQRMVRRRVVEDHPHLFRPLLTLDALRHRPQKVLTILGPVLPRRSMQPVVLQPRPSTGLARQSRSLRRIGHRPRHLKLFQQPLDRRREPRCVARLDNNLPLMQLAHRLKKLSRRALIKRQLRRQLHQHRPQFLSQRPHVIEESHQLRAAPAELRSMCDSLRQLHRETKVIGSRRSPPLKRPRQVRPIERRINLDAIRHPRITLQMRALRCNRMCVELRHPPASRADSHLRAGASRHSPTLHRLLPLPTMTAIDRLWHHPCEII